MRKLASNNKSLISRIEETEKQKLKEIFQKNWDHEFPPEISSKRLKIVQDIIETKEVKYPRCFMSDIDMNDVQEIQLHSFVDSSQVAYRACIYIYIQTLHQHNSSA